MYNRDGDSMRIIIDADACPIVKDIVSLGEKHQLPVLICHDFAHEIQSDYAKVVLCDTGYQSTDQYIVNELTTNDVVITQDYGVAAVCLIKGSYVVHPLGFCFKNQTIDEMLAMRHEHTKMRLQKVRVKGPKKRTKENDEKLLETIEKIILNCKDHF